MTKLVIETERFLIETTTIDMTDEKYLEYISATGIEAQLNVISDIFKENPDTEYDIKVDAGRALSSYKIEDVTYVEPPMENNRDAETEVQK